MLDASGPGLLYIHGPAGIGKSSLIQALDAEARRRSARTVHVDGRDLSVAVEAVRAALDATDLGPAGDEPRRQRVLFFDTYELMRPIEPQVARELLRRITDDTLVVLAGRLPPSAQWRALSLWGSSIVPISLCNLSSDEAAQYLRQRGVAAASVGPIVDFSHGHPLALALAAEGARGATAATFGPDSAIDVITALYDYFMVGIADAERRAALEITAVLHTTSQALLGSFLGAAAAELFLWLRELSFMVPSPHGLFPHDLVREVILAELRWRDPQRLLDLALQGQRLLAAQVQAAASPAEFSRRFTEFTYALSHNPMARILMVAPEEGLYLDDLRPGDEPTIGTIVALHEGLTELRHAQHWLACQPAAFKVAREPAGEVTAFLANIRLDLATAEQREQDPLALLAWRYAERLCGGLPGGPVVYARWYMDAEHHQEPCRGMAVSSQAVGRLFFLPGFALYFVRIHPWPLWEPTAALCHAVQVPELAHEVAGKPFIVTLQDHRGLSGIEWLLRFSERATPRDAAALTPPADTESRDDTLAALNRAEFGVRVREALRALDDPLTLGKNALIHCRAVQMQSPARATVQERAVALRALLVREIAGLQGSKRGEQWARVLQAAYVDAMGKHEGIALTLGMSYSTFRRALAAGTEHVVDAMWARTRG